MHRLLLTVWILFLPSMSAGLSSQAIEPIEHIQKLAIETALEISSEEGVQAKIEGLDPHLSLAACTIPLEARPETQHKSERITVHISCSHPKWTLYVPLRLERFERVLYTARNLARGTHLQESDLREERANTLALHQGYFTKKEEVRNLQVNRALSAGQLLRPSQLSPVQVIRKGQIVQLQALTNGVLVQTQGIALSDGALGEMVPVRNPRSGRIIEGIAHKTGVVRIQL